MEQTDELKEAVLNVAQRRKRGMVLKRMKNRLKIAKERASHRIADGSHLMHRARKLALAMLRKRFAGKLGADYRNLTPGQKIQVDKKVEGKSALVTRIAQKLLPKVRTKEFERYKGRMGGVKEEYVLEGQMEDKYQAISKKEHDDILAQHLNSKASNNHKASKHVFKDDDGKVVTQRYSHADHKLPPVWSKHHGDQKFTYFKRKESVKEEVEQLDELSTATLKSYKTKAGFDALYA